MIEVSFGSQCAEVLKCLNFSGIMFHTFGCEDCTVKADFGLSDLHLLLLMTKLFCCYNHDLDVVLVIFCRGASKYTCHCVLCECEIICW